MPVFKRQRSGHIVNVASLAGLVHPAGMASYNAVKAAVVALTETTGHELAAYGVRASVVCPSYFRTNLMASLQGADTALAGLVAALVESSPLTADDIAAAVLAGVDAGDELIVPDQPARDAWSLKQRVLSKHGHLSNDHVAEFLERDFDGRAEHIVLAHLSKNTNHPDLARLVALQALERRGPLFCRDAERRLSLADADAPGPWIDL